jgi:hypothetical protein
MHPRTDQTNPSLTPAWRDPVSFLIALQHGLSGKSLSQSSN